MDSNAFTTYCVGTMLLCWCSICHLASALDASGDVLVPCGTETTYGPSIDAGTTLILQHCDNSPSGTALKVSLNAASRAAMEGFTIIVQHSRRVSVLILTEPSQNCSILNATVVMRNITNDVDGNSVPISISLLRFSYALDVVNASISLSDIKHMRDTALVRLNFVRSIRSLFLLVMDITTSSYPALIVDTVDASVSLSNITLLNVAQQFTAASVYTFMSILRLQSVAAGVQRSHIHMSGCSTSNAAGAAIASASAACITSTQLIMSNVSVDSHLSSAATTSTTAVAVYVVLAQVESARIAVTNFTSDRSSVTVGIAVIRSEVLSSWISMHAAVITGVPLTTAPSLAVDIQSSSISSSVLLLSNVHMDSGTANLFLILLRIIYSSAAPAQLVDTTVSLHSCDVTSQLPIALYVTNATIRNASIVITNVTTSIASQYMAVRVSEIPTLIIGLFLTVVDSYLTGAFPVLLEVLTAVNSTVSIQSSTLRADSPSDLPNYQNTALRMGSIVLSTSIVMLNDVDVIGIPAGTTAGFAVAVMSSDFALTRVSAYLASITESGGVLSMYNSHFANETSVTITVESNMTIPSTYPFPAVFVDTSHFEGRSSLVARLPSDVSVVGSTEGFLGTMVVQLVSLRNHSLITVGGGQGRPTIITVLEAALHVLGSHVDPTCLITLENVCVTLLTASAAVIINASYEGPTNVAVSNSTFTSTQSMQQFILVTSLSESVSITIARCTFGAAWPPTHSGPPGALIHINNSIEDDNGTVVVIVDQLLLYGVSVLVGAASSNRSGSVSSVTLRCAWWGRHPLVSVLDPLHLALRGTVLRGPFSAVGPHTQLLVDSDSMLTPASPQCATPMRLAAAYSWSPTATHSPVALSSLSLRATSTSSTAPMLPPSLRVFPRLENGLGASGPAVAVVANSLLGTVAGAATLVRSALAQQLVQCASVDGDDDAVAAIISGSNDANLLQIHAGSISSPGYGYRGSLVSAFVLVSASASLLAASAALAHKYRAAHVMRDSGGEHSWRRIAAASGEPGWWLAGPCAMAVAPMLSSGVSLASVSPWVGSADGVLVVLGLVVGWALVAWCCKALLRPRHGGWFTATCRSAARPLTLMRPAVPSTSGVDNPFNAREASLRELIIAITSRSR